MDDRLHAALAMDGLVVKRIAIFFRQNPEEFRSIRLLKLAKESVSSFLAPLMTLNGAVWHPSADSRLQLLSQSPLKYFNSSGSSPAACLAAVRAL